MHEDRTKPFVMFNLPGRGGEGEGRGGGGGGEGGGGGRGGGEGGEGRGFDSSVHKRKFVFRVLCMFCSDNLNFFATLVFKKW